MPFQRGNRRPSDGPPGQLSPEEILALTRQPSLRWQDVSGGPELAQQLALHPHDSALAELFDLTVKQQVSKALCGDPFHANYPAPGQIPRLEVGRIPLCSLPTGDALSKAVHPFSNALVVGPTGGGKTNSLRLIAASLLLAGAIVVVFSPKEDFIDCELLAHQDAVHVLYPHETPIALFQPVSAHADLSGFIQIRVELLAKHLHLEASRRLMLDCLHLLFQRHRPHGQWPTLSELLDMLDRFHLDPTSRKGQYREALLYSLRQVKHSMSQALDWAASDFLQTILGRGARSACYVIHTGGLMAEMAALYASLFIDFAFGVRGLNSSNEAEPPIVFVLDDSIPLLRGGHAAEAEGSGANPVATWAWLGRSRNIHLIGAVQSYSVVSPAFRANTPTVICCGAYGRDAYELAQDLSLTQEQAAMLPLLQPGWCVAIDRQSWPHALLGRTPEAR